MLKLGFEIVQSKVESDKISNFVALGNLLYELESYHAAFIIQYEKSLYEFHYTGESVKYNKIKEDYFHKITTTIDSEEVPAFIAQCQNILKKAKPKYGFFYSGESYNKDGIHLSNVDLGERMTCVGFCLNVLKSFLEEDYLTYSDWNSDSQNDSEWLTNFCKNHKLDISKIQSAHRRITPREFLISGFFSKLPIRKIEIDAKKLEVENYFIAIKKASK